MSLAHTVSEHFAAEFGEAPAFIVRAPGRVNLIGEHTDYNDGFVFPMAINRATWIALRPRDDKRVLAISLDMDDKRQFSLDDLRKPADADWIDYLVGVAWALLERGYALRGWGRRAGWRCADRRRTVLIGGAGARDGRAPFSKSPISSGTLLKLRWLVRRLRITGWA